MIELYPYLLVFLGGSAIVLAIGMMVQVRRHTREANIWQRDWRNVQLDIGRANQSIRELENKYNHDLSYMTQVSEALVEINVFQGKLIHPEDLEEEIEDVRKDGRAASALLVTVGEGMPADLVEYLPKTEAFILGMSSVFDEMAIDPESLELEREANDPDYFD